MPPQLNESLFSADSGGLETWYFPGENLGFLGITTKNQGFTRFSLSGGFENLKPHPYIFEFT